MMERVAAVALVALMGCSSDEPGGAEPDVDAEPGVACTMHRDCPSNLCVDDQCQTTAMAACADVAPENATSAEETVEIEWTASEGWSQPAECPYECVADYCELDEQCIPDGVVEMQLDAPEKELPVWLGWDDNIENRNLGQGERLQMPNDFDMASLALYFTAPFTSVSNGGPGVEAEVKCQLRDASGALLVSDVATIPADIQNEWVWWSLPYSLVESSEYNLTCILLDAEKLQVRAVVLNGESDHIPFGKRIGADTSIPDTGAITDWESWSLTGGPDHDLALRLRSTSACDQ